MPLLPFPRLQTRSTKHSRSKPEQATQQSTKRASQPLPGLPTLHQTLDPLHGYLGIMCGRTDWHQTHSCGHQLPLQPCNAYAHHLEMCLANPGEPRKFVWANMRRAPTSLDECRFCKEGKDIEDEWGYGENWLEAKRWRQ